MERVETDLNKSKQAREKQSREFSKQIEEERNQHERKVFITENPFPLNSMLFYKEHLSGTTIHTRKKYFPLPLNLYKRFFSVKDI